MGHRDLPLAPVRPGRAWRIAVDARTHRSTLLPWLPNTTYVTGLAAAEDAVYLLTDIRGNGQAPRPHLLYVTIPVSARP